jgi:O-antigen/teichoic acid export membrane protein
VVLARFLGPEQLGLAATLVLTGSFFDFISDTGADRFLIQDRDGDKEPVQKLVHLVYIARGATIAMGLALCAWPIALVYHAPQLTSALMILALSPLILGLLHLDLRRAQRHLDFRAEAICMIVAELSGLAATATAAVLTHHFTAILYGLICRAIVMVIVSHLRAERPYRVGFSPEHSARLRRFAIPLMFNGLLLFFATQGDRAVVGNRLGFIALGRYSAILLLIYYPAAILVKYVQAMYLPLLARGRDDPAQRWRTANVMGGQVLILGLAMSAGFAVLAPLAVQILYGARFSQDVMVIALIGVLQSSRFLLVFPNAVAISTGRSGAALAVNVARLVAYPAVFTGAMGLAGLAGVLASFILGELVAHAVGLMLLSRDFQRPLFAGFDRLLIFAFASLDILALTWSASHGLWPGFAAAAAGAVATIGWIAYRERPAIDESLALVLGMLRRPAARPRPA